MLFRHETVPRRGDQHPVTRTILLVLVAVAVILAGCTGPGGQGDEVTDEGGGEPAADSGTAVTTTDNEYGAEPNNPRGAPNGTTVANRTATVNGT